MIPIYKPYLTKKATKYAHEAIDSTWVSSRGPYLDKTSERLKEIFGVKNVLLTNSGTAACHLVAECVKLRGIKSIIAPNNVFVAAWNAFLYENNFEDRILIADTDINTWNMDLKWLNWLKEYISYEALKQKVNEIGILVVHNLGNIVNVPMLQREYPYVTFVEDNCEGLFGTYEGAYSGTKSLCSSFSFFGNKTLTSGEGGAFFTNDDELYEYAKKILSQGETKTKYIHDVLGYNYRMTNVEAALLYGQLEVRDEILSKKKELFAYYEEHLKGLPNVVFQEQESGTTKADWLFAIRFKNAISYDKTKIFFEAKGIETRPLFYPITAHGHFNRTYEVDKIANLLNNQVVMFPSYPTITRKEQNHIIESIAWYSKT